MCLQWQVICCLVVSVATSFLPKVNYRIHYSWYFFFFFFLAYCINENKRTPHSSLNFTPPHLSPFVTRILCLLFRPHFLFSGVVSQLRKKVTIAPFPRNANANAWRWRRGALALHVLNKTRKPISILSHVLTLPLPLNSRYLSKSFLLAFIFPP